MLLQLPVKERERERGPVDGERDPSTSPEQVRERTDVILMTVRENDRLDVVGAVAHVLEVRQHEVDAGHLRVRERQTDVDDQDPAVELDAGHVPPDLADAAEEDDARGPRPA